MSLFGVPKAEESLGLVLVVTGLVLYVRAQAT